MEKIEIEKEKKVAKAKSSEKEMDSTLVSLSEQEKKTNRSNLIVAFLVFVIMSTLGITSFYFYEQYRKPGIVPSVALSSVAQAKKDLDETKAVIGEIMDLPDDEEPILAIVTDATKMKNQSFYVNAINGDRVLIYTLNKKAILFRPSTKKIIKVNEDGGLNQSTTANSPAESASKESVPSDAPAVE